MTRIISAWLLALAAFVAVPPLHAADQKVPGELVAEQGVVAPGGETRLALSMTPQPGWHGYWKNGGDAGFGMRLDWDLPDGVTVSQGHYPVPHIFMLQGLMNHVYEQPYAILFDVSVSPDLTVGTTLPIRAKGNWLACSDEVCLPQQGAFAITLRVGADGAAATAAAAGADARFDAWLAKIPSRLSEVATYQRSGGSLRLSVPYPEAAPLDDPHFFAESEDFVDYVAGQRFERSGDRLLIELAADPQGRTPDGPLNGVLKIGSDRGLALTAKAGIVPALTQTAGLDAIGGASGLALTFLAALLGGLILNVMPCVFPILGLKALSLAKAGGDERTARREALGYTLGAVLMAVALGGVILLLRAAGEQVGWAFQLQSPATILFLLLLMVAITANLIGLFELPGGNFAQATNMRSSVATGALAAFVATPCTGPFMAAALGASLLLPWPAALLLFFALGLGLALPFLAIGYSRRLRRMLPRSGPWLARFRGWMALPMGLTALALGWLWLRIGGSAGWLAIALAALLVLLLFLAGRRQRGGQGVAPALAAAALLIAAPPVLIALFPAATAGNGARNDAYDDIAFSEAKLTELRAGGRPVFLYFTADWCITCKANEAAALDREEVRAAFDKAGIAVMRGDFTRPDPAIARFLSRHGRAGVPYYLFYPAGGGEPAELPQILTPGRLIGLTQADSD